MGKNSPITISGPNSGKALIRLNRFLADSGRGSRREADGVIFSGKVTINGTVATSPAQTIDPERDSVKIAGKRIWAQPLVYVLFHKPKGVITTAEDPKHRRTVVELLHGVRSRVYPVGRLDVNTSGLLLLTNDGEMAFRLTHPRFGFAKTYLAKVSDIPSPGDLRKLASGVRILQENGRTEITLPAKVRQVRTFEKNALLEITVQEGRYHQVRKMCAAIGHPVLRLERVKFGFLTTAGLPPGRWRYLTPDEIRRLKASSRTSAE